MQKMNSKNIKNLREFINDVELLKPNFTLFIHLSNLKTVKKCPIDMIYIVLMDVIIKLPQSNSTRSKILFLFHILIQKTKVQAQQSE